MAERIVSPGVFTRERDLSFLPQGIANIGAAIVGPTKKGPSFVPTVVTSFEDFKNIFGDYTTDFYTPYTVREYLRSAGSVTIVRVGHLGGYKTGAFNLLAEVFQVEGSTPGSVTGSVTRLLEKTVVATFLPGIANNEGEGSISGSIPADTAALTQSISNFTLTVNGANATASFAGLNIMENSSGGSQGGGTFLATSDVVGGPRATTMGSTSRPAYIYKYFQSSMSSSFTDGTGSAVFVTGSVEGPAGTDTALSASISIANGTYGKIHIENLGDDAFDMFTGGGDSVNAGTYETTNSGNKDACAARTPWIQSQQSDLTQANTQQNLFRIYMRADGTATNNHYIVVRDIKSPSNANSSPEYAEFGLSLYEKDGNLLESFGKLNMDPASANYIVKAIGDQFQAVDNDGKLTYYGDYPNMSKYIRVGDYNEQRFVNNKSLQPMGHAALLDPVKTSYNVPAATMNDLQKDKKERYDGDSSLVGSPNLNVPYGFKINEAYFKESELSTNHEYLSPIPYNESAGQNVTMSLQRMPGFGADSNAVPVDQDANKWTLRASYLTISSSADQLKFVVPMQHGFDGVNPAKEIYTGYDITATNTMGYDCSTAVTSGSIAYKRAINAVSNPDEIDINMLVTPGVLHKLHSTVTNHAMSKIADRADAFYVMDSAAYDDTVITAVDNIKQLDTNYVATYYPWVKIDDPSSGQSVWVPPSVVIPGVIAFTDRVAHEWFAPAGLNRGGLSSVRVAKKKLTHTERDTLYEGRVNPIASFPGQGVVVFGQKTLQSKPSALDRINVRRLLIKLKKFIASSSRFLVFEQNDSSTRARFLNIVNPFLESVQANSGLSAFKVVMDDSNNTPDVIDRNQLVGQIFIQPTRTAEFIVLDFTVLPTGAAFPE